jgi:hypothetical protein
MTTQTQANTTSFPSEAMKRRNERERGRSSFEPERKSTKEHERARSSFESLFKTREKGDALHSPHSSKPKEKRKTKGGGKKEQERQRRKEQPNLPSNAPADTRKLNR